MGLPWKAKKYVAEIFSGGIGTVTYTNYGKSRGDSSKKYGSGGAKQLETYAVYDLFKGDLNLDNELEKFEKLLTNNFLSKLSC